MNLARAKSMLRPYIPAILLFVAGSIAAHATFALWQEPKPQASTNQPLKQVSPVQPLPFSHKLHAALQRPCQFCHPNPEPGNLMNLPTADACMTCHESVGKDRPAIRTLTQYARSNQTLPWVRVYVVPGFVYWSHRTHLDAEISCEQCHGKVSEMDAMSLATKVTTMAGCVDCHKRRKATTGCAACHEAGLS